MYSVSALLMSRIPRFSMNYVPNILKLLFYSTLCDLGLTAASLASSYWNQLSLNFEPSLPERPSTLMLTLEPAQFLNSGMRLQLSLPGLTYTSTADPTLIEFAVIISQGIQMNLFNYYAMWSINDSTLSFVLVADFPVGTVARISLLDNYFTLPASSEKDSNSFQALVTSEDGSEIIFPLVPFLNADPVLSAVRFVESSLSLAGSGFRFSFSLNRGVFAGDVLVLRLPGYHASGSSVPVTYSSGHGLAFVGDSASFDPANFTFSLELGSPLGTDLVSFEISNVLFPQGQSGNDESLQAAILPWDFEAIKSSPAFGVKKEFVLSSLGYDPVVPLSAAGINITFQPSVELYGGTEVVIHLRGGFTRTTSAPDVFLYGTSADIFGCKGVWNGSAISLTVKPETQVGTTQLTSVWIPVSEGFVLPSLLSENDGVILIESRSMVVIPTEPIKVSPQVGLDAKKFFASPIVFDPADSDSATQVSFSFTSNTELLPGSTVLLNLGGLSKNPSTGLSVILSGSGTDFFGTSAIWDPNLQSVVLRVKDFITLPVSAPISLVIPVTSGFVLPASLMADDKSLYLVSESCGIPDPQFFSSSPRINQNVAKQFRRSELWYGASSSELPFPGKAGNLSLRIEPTFDLLPGADLVVRLPGFKAESSAVTIESSPLKHLFVNNAGSWNGTSLALSVAPDSAVKAGDVVSITVGDNQFTLPEEKLPNDPSLQLEVTGHQWLPAEPIKTSVAVVPRRFTVSTLSLIPETPVTTAEIIFSLEATVNVIPSESVIIQLSGFTTQIESLDNITVLDSLGQLNCSATWDPAPSDLLAFSCQNTWYANTLVTFTIPKSMEFQVPRSLALNSPLVTIGVPDSIATAPFLSSPLVGDGPYRDQQFCMLQYDQGVRVHVNNAFIYPELTECLEASECSTTDWIRDACSVSQLTRCGCGQLIPGLSEDPTDGLTIAGFNLGVDDKLFFASANCDGSGIVLSIQQLGNPIVSETGGLIFPRIRALETGQFKVCLNDVYVGDLTVRTACPSPLVAYNGGCFSYCPYGFVPIYGECRMIVDAKNIFLANQPIAFQLGLVYTGASSLDLVNLPASDPARQFFDYQFDVNLKLVLNEPEESERFHVVGVRNASSDTLDSIIVSVVIAPDSGRSPYELFLLLSALVHDEYSILYANSFFSSIIRTFPLRNITSVRWCSSANTYYLGGCPSLGGQGSPTDLPSWYTLAVTLGGSLGGLVFSAILLAFYRLDSSDLRVSNIFRKKRDLIEGKSGNDFSVVKITESSEDKELTVEVLEGDLSQLDYNAKVEFAKTWLDGKMLDEPLILKRRTGQVS
jgi:hypothetical protein